MLSRIGKRILAQARLLVNSVKIALRRITTTMIVTSDAPTMKLNIPAIEDERSDAYQTLIKLRR
jgi:hypothetical protein